MRENSPIENVVIDLSINGGGAATAAIYTVAWFLGTCTINVNNTLTKQQASTSYKADVNCDRKFDENDTVSSKNLYCLISPNSFSCGNLLPSIFKNAGNVTLIGKPSGGGACTIQYITTADGNIFRISSANRLSSLYNGSYYNVDRGVEPDFHLSKIESFYNRESLTDYINNLH